MANTTGLLKLSILESMMIPVLTHRDQQKRIAELQWDFHVDLRKGWPKLDHKTIYLGSLFNSLHSDVKISVAKGGNEIFFLSNRDVHKFCTLRPYYPT